MRSVPRVMTIAGSDCGGGAGIQADLKTFSALRVYGTSVLTAVTSQNTRQVTDVMDIPAAQVSSQIDAVMSDIGTDAVKTGMLPNITVIEIVAKKIREYGLEAVVVDPVMIAKSGDRLMQEEAVDALRTLLIPLAQVVTPNAPEAAILAGRDIETLDDARAAAYDIIAMGAKSVVVKGGHLPGPATDIMFDGVEVRAFTAQRINTTSTHGTGCTFASAIAVGLSKGRSVRDAVSDAKTYVTSCIRHAFPMGLGHGPLNHFHSLWDDR